MVEPNGQAHNVAAHELFFSTTDSRGVIDLSNSVFIRMSRYERVQLVGAPHNIIRHPHMPGGAFKMMWETISGGEPFGAYVTNMAADGSEYRVFATVTPLDGGGYLSVRSAPMNNDLAQAANRIYSHVRQVENAAALEGQNRRACARLGAQALVSDLELAGFASYDDFMHMALTSEVSAWEAHNGDFPVRDSGSQLGELLSEAHQIHTYFSQWMKDQEQLHHLVEKIGGAVAHVRSTMADMAHVGQEFSAHSVSRPDLTMPLSVWISMQDIIGGYMDGLVAKLTELRANIKHTQVNIALSRLHLSMYGQFVCELIDMQNDPDSVRSLRMLGRALREDFARLDMQVARTSSLIQNAKNYVRNVSDAVAIPRQLLGVWETTTGQAMDSAVETELAAAVAHAKSKTDTAISALEAFYDHLGTENLSAHNREKYEAHLAKLCDVGNV